MHSDQAATPGPIRDDRGHWASPRERLAVDDAVRHVGFNIAGKRVAGPPQGFGRLWQRSYAADLGADVSPETVIADWRARFGSYWPRSGRFYGAMRTIEPGDVAPLTAGGVTTGILVIYADETSFTFLTPEGHLFAALITFSAVPSAAGSTTARIDVLLRTSDPVFELAWPALRLGEDSFWRGTLRNLAREHGVDRVTVESRTECVDRRRVWRNWRNVRDNAAVRSAVHALGAPWRERDA